MKPKPPAFVDLFAGCGGMTLGLMRAGWKGLFAIEKNPMAFQTIEANFLSKAAASRGTLLAWPKYLPRKPIAIEDLLHGDYQKHLCELEGELDLVSGGPPCQGFSFSGRRNQDDVRNSLVHAYAEFVLRVRPKLLLMENVPGILVPHGKRRRDVLNPSRGGRTVKSYAQQLFDLLGNTYLLQQNVLDAADFGVPQRRSRFFVVGILRTLLPNDVGIVDNRLCSTRDGVTKHEGHLDPFAQLRDGRRDFLANHGLDPDREITAAEAIGDLSPGKTDKTRPCEDPESPRGFSELAYEPPDMEQASAFVRLMRTGLNGQIPNSLRLARHTPKVRERFSKILDKCRRGVRMSDSDRSRYSTTLKHRIVPLAAARASHTLTTLPDDLIHYSRPRILTVRESGRLQSFPDWFEFHGKYTTGGGLRRTECPRFTQVGNAVPPLIAEAWGSALLPILDGLERLLSKSD